MRPRRPPTPTITLSERLVAAVLTPLFFNLSLLILAAYISGRSFRYTLHWYAQSGRTFWLMLAIPAVIGFFAGTERTARLMGHAFGTNHGSERSLVMSVLVWLGLALMFWLGLSLMPD